MNLFLEHIWNTVRCNKSDMHDPEVSQLLYDIDRAKTRCWRR